MEFNMKKLIQYIKRKRDQLKKFMEKEIIIHIKY